MGAPTSTMPAQWVPGQTESRACCISYPTETLSVLSLPHPASPTPPSRPLTNPANTKPCAFTAVFRHLERSLPQPRQTFVALQGPPLPLGNLPPVTPHSLYTSTQKWGHRVPERGRDTKRWLSWPGQCPPGSWPDTAELAKHCLGEETGPQPTLTSPRLTDHLSLWREKNQRKGRGTYKSALTKPFPSVSKTLKAWRMVSSGSVPRNSTYRQGES